MKSVGFYTPEFYELSNFSPHSIEVEGMLYPTSEHAYQAAKCTDPAGKEAIRQARSPMEAKHFANRVYRTAKDPAWDDKKTEVMEVILRTKLAQHVEVQEALHRSGDRLIVEDSPTDYFWGEGRDGSGQNILGKLWMKLRAELLDSQ